MKMVHMLAALTCWLAAAGTSVAERAAAQPAERGGVASEQVQLRAGGRDASVQLGDLVGAPLENRHGTRIGQIDDVVVDLATRRLDYAVVRFDADWLGTSKHVAVPARALVDAAPAPPAGYWMQTRPGPWRCRSSAPTSWSASTRDRSCRRCTGCWRAPPGCARRAGPWSSPGAEHAPGCPSRAGARSAGARAPRPSV